MELTPLNRTREELRQDVLTVPRILVRPEGELPGFIRQLFGPPPRQTPGCQPSQGSVRTPLVVMPSPRPDLGLRVGQRQEPMCVEALIPQTLAERLDEGVVGRLAGSRQVERDPALIGPAVECFRDKLGPIIDPGGPRCFARGKASRIITATTCSPLLAGERAKAAIDAAARDLRGIKD